MTNPWTITHYALKYAVSTFGMSWHEPAGHKTSYWQA